jgi:hypothetical protein
MLWASHFGRFSPEEGSPSTDWIGAWVGPRWGLNIVEQTITCAFRREWTPILRSSSLQTGHYTNWAIQTYPKGRQILKCMLQCTINGVFKSWFVIREWSRETWDGPFQSSNQISRLADLHKRLFNSNKAQGQCLWRPLSFINNLLLYSPLSTGACAAGASITANCVRGYGNCCLQPFPLGRFGNASVQSPKCNTCAYITTEWRMKCKKGRETTKRQRWRDKGEKKQRETRKRKKRKYDKEQGRKKRRRKWMQRNVQNTE